MRPRLYVNVNQFWLRAIKSVKEGEGRDKCEWMEAEEQTRSPSLFSALSSLHTLSCHLCMSVLSSLTVLPCHSNLRAIIFYTSGGEEVVKSWANHQACIFCILPVVHYVYIWLSQSDFNENTLSLSSYNNMSCSWRSGLFHFSRSLLIFGAAWRICCLCEIEYAFTNRLQLSKILHSINQKKSVLNSNMIQWSHSRPQN